MREGRNARGSLRARGRSTADGEDAVESELERDPLKGDLHENRLCLSDPATQGQTTIETAVISNNSLNLSSSVFLDFFLPQHPATHPPPPPPPRSFTSSPPCFPPAVAYPFPSPNLLICLSCL